MPCITERLKYQDYLNQAEGHPTDFEGYLAFLQPQAQDGEYIDIRYLLVELAHAATGTVMPPDRVTLMRREMTQYFADKFVFGSVQEELRQKTLGQITMCRTGLTLANLWNYPTAMICIVCSTFASVQIALVDTFSKRFTRSTSSLWAWAASDSVTYNARLVRDNFENIINDIGKMIFAPDADESRNQSMDQMRRLISQFQGKLETAANLDEALRLDIRAVAGPSHTKRAVRR